ncbi:MAG: CPBP family intramembrane metalloprotease [Clostridia bacterium]|nr:CPBP family intramembrane metalloprotease [Clostridia bacterium]
MEEKEEALKRACLAAALSVLLLFLTLFLSGWVQIQADSVLRESVKSPFLLSALLYGVRAFLYAGSFGIPIWIGFREMRKNGINASDSPEPFPRGALLGCLLLPGIVFAASRVWSWAMDLLRSFGISFREPSLLAPERPEEWIFYLILIVIVAPVLEEWFFRGVLLPLLRTFGDWFAILFSAILFGLMHGSVPQFLYPAAAGVALGWCVLRSRSVWVGVCMHAANNLYAFLMEWTCSGLTEEQAAGRAVFWEIGGYLLAVLAVILIRVSGSFRKDGDKPLPEKKPRLTLAAAVPLAITLLLWVGDLIWNSIQP